MHAHNGRCAYPTVAKTRACVGLQRKHTELVARELEEVRATSPLLSLLGPVGVKKVPSPATLVGVKL